jgi:hypothetical protein
MHSVSLIQHDTTDTSTIYAKLLSQRVHASATFIKNTNNVRLCIGELCRKAILAAGDLFENVPSMNRIFTPCAPLKVFQSTIVFITVFVIYVGLVLRVWKKSQRHKPMRATKKGSKLSTMAFAQSNLAVSIWNHFRSNDAGPTAPPKLPNAAHGTNFIRGEVFYGRPLFGHVHNPRDNPLKVNQHHPFPKNNHKEVDIK